MNEAFISIKNEACVCMSLYELFRRNVQIPKMQEFQTFHGLRNSARATFKFS